MEVDRIGRVARFTLNRPEKRNALNAETCREMLEAFDRAQPLKQPGAPAKLQH